MYDIVASINSHGVIGENGKLYIRSKKDMSRFSQITTYKYYEKQNAVIMGYNTWIDIPENKRPLKSRINIIITKNHKEQIDETDSVIVKSSLEEAFNYTENLQLKTFVIGGEQIFNECFEKYKEQLNVAYITIFNEDMRELNPMYDRGGNRVPNVSLFPLKLLDGLYDVKNSELMDDIGIKNGYEQPIKLRFHYYQNLNSCNKSESQYLNLMNNILINGDNIQTRNSEVFSTFGERMIFDLSEGFPLLTTKKMGYKTILRELLWFISGSTSNQALNDVNVHIWDKNASREFLDSRGLKDYPVGDLGPVYGFQWRHFGESYFGMHYKYENGVDQLKYVIDQIKNDPTSRRIILSAWNPVDLDKMALPPCHVMCQFNVDIKNKKLNCQLYQRSGDMFLGVPFNIASYSFLLSIIAKITGYQPGKFIHILGDSHIYSNHTDAVKKQMIRIPYKFPTLVISDELTDIDSIKEEYFTIENYKYYEKIEAEMIA